MPFLYNGVYFLWQKISKLSSIIVVSIEFSPIYSTEGKRAKRMPDATVETTQAILAFSKKNL